MQIRVVATGSTPQERRDRRWGLSLLIGESVLFDTFGLSSPFIENLSQMTADISRIRHVVLSHEHWDHVTGLERLAEKNRTATIYICPHTDSSVKAWIKGLGMPVVEVGGWIEIEKGLFSTGEIKGFWNGQPMWEQSLVISEGHRLSVLTGCAHTGLSPILQSVQGRFPDPVTLLMGGFHLMNSTQEEVLEVIATLKKFGVRQVAPMHCTGEAAVTLLQNTFKNEFLSAEEGSRIET
ncbi:MAG: Beta-lactamase superfamily domain protein [Syntrophus sp. PtaB.Bin001]|nr:MAG: Beta-lactamase superfamily domain protein [Syntrophus sp. PtaB.Bin001]